MINQLRALKQNPHVIIGTPGRLNDHIDRKTLHLDTVHTIVLDEADLMLDMGFGPQIKTILEVIPKPRQTMLFSATMPQEIEKISARYMVNPARVEIAKAGSTPDKITQKVQYIENDKKTHSLQTTLTDHGGSAIVFVRTKHRAKKICSDLKMMNHSVAEIHSNRTLAQRRAALDGFKTGRHRILVATDIAARGIDVSGIGLVVNYDLPENPEDYVHRIGRTGRAGQKGHAISFATKAQQQLVRRIERLMNVAIPAEKGHASSLSGDRVMQPVRLDKPARGTAKQTNYSPKRGFRNIRGKKEGYARPWKVVAA